MGRKYKIHDQSQIYFVIFTVVNWIDIFTRPEYREIFIDSVKYCQQHKGLELYAWCIMTNHVHLIIGTNQSNELQDIIRDLKSYTSRHIRKAIEQHPGESRKEWLLWMFGKAGVYNTNNKDWQLWQQHSHPIELNNATIAMQKLNYLHDNPVTAGYVSEPQHWLWSSAYDYAGGKGLLDIIFIYLFSAGRCKMLGLSETLRPVKAVPRLRLFQPIPAIFNAFCSNSIRH